MKSDIMNRLGVIHVTQEFLDDIEKDIHIEALFSTLQIVDTSPQNNRIVKFLMRSELFEECNPSNVPSYMLNFSRNADGNYSMTANKI